MSQTHDRHSTRRRRAPTGASRSLCVAFFAGMIGMAYASVPLYAIFCQVTGYGGTTQRVDAVSPTQVLDRKMTVRFDTNVAGGLPWTFKPVAREVT